MSVEENKLWGWGVSEDDHDPLIVNDQLFNSKEEAIADARKRLELGTHFFVGWKKYGKASEFVPDADDFAEQIDELAHDTIDWSWHEDVLFYVAHDKRDEATAALRAWADKYLGTSHAWTLADCTEHQVDAGHAKGGAK